MYGITCPYCEHENLVMEVEGFYGHYIPNDCEECHKRFYIYHQSWFDITYDTSNVEVKTQEQIDKMVKAGKAKVSGGSKTDKTVKLYCKVLTKAQEKKRLKEIELNKQFWHLDEPTTKGERRGDTSPPITEVYNYE